MAVAELFRALGEPTRLAMVQRLSSGAPHTISSVSKGLEIRRQGARKHLGVLAEAGLVTLESNGRDTTVALDRNALDEGRAFIAELGQQWEARLEALRRYIEENEAKS